jgi:hypothetical protein
MLSEMVGMKRAARFTSRMSNECSADELHPRKMVRAPGNAPGPGTHLVRLRL